MKANVFARIWCLVILAYGSFVVYADDATVLLPLGLFRTPGAFGSLWQTELSIKNTNAAAIQISHAGSQCSIVCPFPTFELSSGKSIAVDNPVNEQLVASTSGLILHIEAVPMVSGSDVHFNLRIRDLSRTTSSWGTELPVVRASQFNTSPIELLNVPVTPGFRLTVRVYALDGQTPVPAVARVYDLGTGLILAEVSFVLDRSSDQSATYYPAYAQLDALTKNLTGLTGESVVIEILPSQIGQRLWAFASITNNDTQDVTTITPQ